jgi:hypothetical protein
LSDTDSAMADEGLTFTRFVDDYRIFLKSEQSPYAALAFLAEHLAATEGLSLNAQKTRIYTKDEFESLLTSQQDDVFDKAEREAIDALSQSLYFDEEPDQDEIAKISALNLVEMLKEEIDKEYWDFGKIRLIFLGLRVTKNADAIELIIERFNDLLPFVKEFVLLVVSLDDAGVEIGDSVWSKVVELLGSGAVSSVPTIQVWLLELFVRDCFSIDNKSITKFSNNTLSRRQSYIIRGLNKDVNFFRRNKTRFEELNVFEKWHFIIGATCLPSDEYTNWLSAIKPNLHRPLDRRFCDWAKNKCGELNKLVNARGPISSAASTE